jgi:hypothetical protein
MRDARQPLPLSSKILSEEGNICSGRAMFIGVYVMKPTQLQGVDPQEQQARMKGRVRVARVRKSIPHASVPMPCPRCGATMDDIVTIPPLAEQPGLVAYECPKCQYVTSVLVHPERPNARH